ncbi:MAG: four helix bundle protein [Ruminococcaceae bacterium]|nr:four helix bundle protein [Oscillospiraceae bacterium]
MKENIVADKSRRFAVRIIKLYKYLKENHCEYVMSKQILRCGTSIGANISEAKYAESRDDFVHKLRIALKEAAETAYWLNILNETDYIYPKLYDSLNSDCVELIKLLTNIINTTIDN